MGFWEAVRPREGLGGRSSNRPMNLSDTRWTPIAHLNDEAKVLRLPARMSPGARLRVILQGLRPAPPDR